MMQVSQSPVDVERTLLLSYLSAQREHALGILEGLEDDALRRQLLPSGWTCLGMIQHLALDIERFWFRAVIAGEPDVIEELNTSRNAWHVAADIPAPTIIGRYRSEIDHANFIIATTSLEAAPAWWPVDRFGDWRIDTVREIILHVITETACHTGHLDVSRELIDGRRWFVLDA